MPTAEPPTRVYEPRPADKERIEALAQSDAPMRIYQPHPPQNSGRC